MPRIFSLIVVVFFLIPIVRAQQQHILFLNNKPDTIFNINSPSKFLSAKSIERRNKQQIAINITDVPVSKSYLSDIAQTGVTVKSTSKWLNAVLIQGSNAQIIAAQQLPFVLNSVFAAPNSGRLMNNFEGEVNNTNHQFISGRTSGVIDSGSLGNSFNQHKMLGTTKMLADGITGKNVLIAVLDAGFFRTNQHEAFSHLFNNNQIKATADFVKIDGEVYADNSHGASVLSVMAAHMPMQCVGMAPDADYLLIRTENTSGEYIIECFNWIVGAEYADSVGADIINSSLGYNTFDNATQDFTFADLDGKTTIITQGAIMAARKGMLVVSSAGNYGSSDWKYILAPSDADSILTVGGVTPDSLYVESSSVGPTSDGRLKPEVVAQGSGVYIANVFTTNTYSTGTGTSFAAPAIAGLAAGLWQKFPFLSAQQLRNVIMKSAHMYNNPNYKMGHGIPNYIRAVQLVNNGDTGSTPTRRSSGKFQFLPSPAVSTKLTLWSELKYNSAMVISVYDLSGRLITSHNQWINSGDNRLTIPELTAGLYIATVMQNNEILFSQKLLITRQ